MTAFYTLLRAHDAVWEDKTWPLQVRVEACEILWRLALEQALYPCGSASTAVQSTSLIERVDAVIARAKP